MVRKKNDIITFKVDSELLEAMKGIENRSDFIRSAILSALDNTCPLCKGSGKLSPAQQRHWNVFSQTHNITECDECNELIITCSLDDHEHH